MRLRTAIPLLSFALPVAAFALSFTDQTEEYTDAPFNSAETAGISVLTEIDAVQGYPDGSFQPEKNLNRAEYVKIVLLSHPATEVSMEDDEGCFPDVGRWDWFRPFVCHAKEQGIVSGYPDGFFRPEQSVNYAEALKILGTMYSLVAEVSAESEWFVRYREGAYAAGVGLPGLEQNMEHLLTRGEMARLAAAYRAHSEGQLEAYRAMERGSTPRSGSSSSSDASDSSISRSSSSVASSSSSISRWTHPAQSHFLIIGARTPPIATGLFQFSAPMDVRLVTVEMKKEFKSAKELHLVDQRGRTLVTLKPDKSDTTDRRWKGTADAGQSTVGPGTLPLAIEATIRTNLEGGFPEEFVEVKNMSMFIGETETVATTQALPVEWAHPGHQTATLVIDKVENAGPQEGQLIIADDQALAWFRFSGRSTGATLAVETLTLTPKMPAGVSIDQVRVRRAGSTESQPCSLGGDGFITCGGIPSSVGAITGGALTLEFVGNVHMVPGTQGSYLQLLLDDPGSITTLGAVHWTDGTGHFRWIESEAPLATGTAWEG